MTRGKSRKGALKIIGILFLLVLSGCTACQKQELPYQEITISEDALENKFYYQQLQTEEEKTVYKEIYQGVQDNTAEIYLHTDNAEVSNDVFQYVLDDMPEIFWCDGSAESTSYNKTVLREGYTVITVNYTYAGDEKEAKNQEIEAAAAECLSQVPAEGSEYEKIKNVYEYLINTVDYNMDAPDNQNIYSALVGKKSVCAGYARSMQYLLERLGIYCAYVTGTAKNNEGGVEDHAWNMVKCDGEYYQVDVTWGDPVFQEEIQLETERLMTYDYLCCSDDEIKNTHTLREIEGVTYPACTSDAYNYYKINGMYYETADEETLVNAMYHSIENGEPATVFKFADAALYQQSHDAILNDYIDQGAQYLGELYWLYEITYSYEENPLLNKLIVYWNYE